MPAFSGMTQSFYAKFRCIFGLLGKILIMAYEYLKILHIISASLIIGSILYSYRIWLAMPHSHNRFALFARIQKQTAYIIIPATLIQLGSGFTLISLQHYTMSDWWIGTSLLGFSLLVVSWVTFVYFLYISEQDIAKNDAAAGQGKQFAHRAQSLMLMLCALSVVIMIFAMANRFTGPHGAT